MRTHRGADVLPEEIREFLGGIAPCSNPGEDDLSFGTKVPKEKGPADLG